MCNIMFKLIFWLHFYTYNFHPHRITFGSYLFTFHFTKMKKKKKMKEKLIGLKERWQMNKSPRWKGFFYTHSARCACLCFISFFVLVKSLHFTYVVCFNNLRKECKMVQIYESCTQTFQKANHLKQLNIQVIT